MVPDFVGMVNAASQSKDWPNIDPVKLLKKSDTNRWFSFVPAVARMDYDHLIRVLLKHHVSSIWDGRGVLIVLGFKPAHFTAWVCGDRAMPNVHQIVYDALHKLYKLDEHPEFQMKYSLWLGIFPTLQVTPRDFTIRANMEIKKYMHATFTKLLPLERNIVIRAGNNSFCISHKIKIDYLPPDTVRSITYIMADKKMTYEKDQIETLARRAFPKDFGIRCTVLEPTQSFSGLGLDLAETHMGPRIFVHVTIPENYVFPIMRRNGKKPSTDANSTSGDDTKKRARHKRRKPQEKPPTLKPLIYGRGGLDSLTKGMKDAQTPLFLRSEEQRERFESRFASLAGCDFEVVNGDQIAKLDEKYLRQAVSDDEEDEAGPSTQEKERTIKVDTPGTLALPHPNPGGNSKYVLHGILSSHVPRCYYCKDYGHLKRQCPKNKDPSSKAGRKKWKAAHKFPEVNM